MNNGNNYPVYVESAELDNSFDSEFQNTLYMMQEGINDVIQSITSNKNFSEEEQWGYHSDPKQNVKNNLKGILKWKN